MAEFKLGFLGHGADYNPDQWRHIPGTLEADLRLMKLSGSNLMNVGIFAWAALEPEEGKYEFGWLRELLDKLHENGVSAFLATPSAARPAWMDEKYPEVMRTRQDGLKYIHGERHNHCFTSPAYRHLVTRMNTRLAEEFADHPAVVGWHISNEYGGECHCDACQHAFRAYLKEKYGTLEKLNQEWWTGFWAKTYTDWSQIHSPSELGESAVHGLSIDWQRFVTHQTIDFMRAELAPIRRISPDKPVTTNMHGLFPLDYYKFAREIDFISYDAYPTWDSGRDIDTAHFAAFNYDAMRAMQKKPWALMESTPSMTNWQEVCRPKRPGMHMLSSMQALAHGADTVQYFQWRKSRGACEKLHGAVVGHDGTENTRVFRDVSAVGARLKALAAIEGACSKAPAAVLFDQENRWAVEGAFGPRREKQHVEQVLEHYGAIKNLGIDVDVIDMDCDFADYKLISAPMLYMIKPRVAQRLAAFVEAGGTLVVTYWTGIVNENDLCFLGGAPGPLRELLGVWCEETDAYYPHQKNAMVLEDGREIECGFLADVLHAEGTQVRATFRDDYYAGFPAITENRKGKGGAWYIASRMGATDLTDFYCARLPEAKIAPLAAEFGAEMQITSRGAYLFLLNFSGEESWAVVPACEDADTGARVEGKIALAKNEARILKRI